MYFEIIIFSLKYKNQKVKNKKRIPPHSYQLKDIFKKKWTNALKGKLLEIGCGSGSDLEVFLKLKKLKV